MASISDPLVRSDRRPRVALSRIVDALSPTLLAPSDITGADQDVLDVVIYDPADTLLAGPGDLVLAVGVRGRVDAERLALTLAERGAAGMVAKYAEGDAMTGVVTAGGGDTRDANQIAVLSLATGASWAHVAMLVRSLLMAASDRGEGGEDLFDLADAVSALLDAPVTIEDRWSRVLAFSGRQDEADTGRRDTILGRQVPSDLRQQLEAQGVFARLARASDAVYVEPFYDGMLPRLAVGIRAGGELLGSMWAAVHGPPPAGVQTAFADAAKLVALQVLRLRAGADVNRRLQADLLATVLEGGRGAGEAANRLGIASGNFCVLAARSMPDPAQLQAAEEERLARALVVHCAALWPRSAGAVIGGVVYAVLSGLPATEGTAGGGRAPSIGAELATEFVRRIGGQQQAAVGVGRSVARLADLDRSRRDADRALQVLRHPRLSSPQRQVAHFAEVQTDSLLLRLADIASEDDGVSLAPVAALEAYDAAHRAGLVETLSAYLDAFGDIALASAAIHVHPNTFRYRLRRAREIGGIDLADARQRLALTLHLELQRLRAG